MLNDVFLDLLKAFDTVDHEILLAKLEHLMHVVTLKWFKTFLTQSKYQYIYFHQKLYIKNSH